MIGKEDIQKLGTLARVQLSDSEAEGLSKDVEAILSYVSQIQEVGVRGAPAQHPLRNVMREDGEPHPAGAYSKELLAEAPKREGDYIAVKPILSRDA